jgi:hypothetical protein
MYVTVNSEAGNQSDERHNKLVLVFAALEKLAGRQWT